MSTLEYDPVRGLPKESGWPALFWEASRQSRNPMVLLDARRTHVEVNGACVQLSVEEWKAIIRRRQFTGATESEPSRPSAEAPLTNRERDVLELIALGLTGPEIALELHIAHHTVRTHVRNSMKKTGARSRAHLVAVLLANDLLGPTKPDD